MDNKTTLIDGRCHCGNISFSLKFPVPPDNKIPVRTCGCSFCQKHGGNWTSNPSAKLEIIIHDESSITKYRFDTETASFYICSKCGVVPFVISEIENRLYAVVNTNTFENNDSFIFDAAPADFDGEDTGMRLDRRKNKWIPGIVFNKS